MKKLLLLLIVLFIHGCAGIAPGSKGTVLLHEASESRLLTEAEFMARASQSADQIYEGMSAINDAVSLYDR